jgi:hypothetical protein
MGGNRLMGRRARISLTLGGSILAIALTAGPAMAAGGGWLDPTFGSGGVRRVPSPVAAYTKADHLVLRVGPTGRIFLFEDMSSGDTSDSAFLRARTSSGATLTAFHGGTIPYLSSSGDGAVYNLGLAPLADGGVVYSTITGDVATAPGIMTVRRAADGHVVGSRSGVPGLALSFGDGISPFTRLPGGSLRFCGETTVGVGPAAVRIGGLTSTLATDVRVGPAGYRGIPLQNCQGIASDSAGHVYVVGTTPTVGGHRAIEVVALTSSGSLVTSWGDNGHRVIADAAGDLALAGGCSSVGTGQFRALDDGTVVLPIEVRPDGACATSNAGVAWIKKAGDFVRTITFDPSGGRWQIFGFDVDSKDRAVVSLGHYLTGGTPKAYIGRLTNLGILDPAFGVEGLVPVSRAPRSLDVDGADRIVGATPDGADVLLSRRTG